MAGVPIAPRFSGTTGVTIKSPYTGIIQSPGPVLPTRPVANPVKVVNPVTNGLQFGLNRLPSGGAVNGLPSPSVGSVLGQTGRVPVPVLSGLPYATPNVNSSFGAPASTGLAIPARGGPQQNFIGERS